MKSLYINPPKKLSSATKLKSGWHSQVKVGEKDFGDIVGDRGINSSSCSGISGIVGVCSKSSDSPVPRRSCRIFSMIVVKEGRLSGFLSQQDSMRSCSNGEEKSAGIAGRLFRSEINDEKISPTTKE